MLGSILLPLAAMAITLLLAQRAAPLAPGVPYVWGFFCGCLALLQAAGKTAGYFTSGGYDGVSLLVAGLFVALAIVAGIGLLKRRRFGVWAFFAALIAGWLDMDWSGMAQSPIARLGLVAPLLTVAAVYVPTAVYFRRRWALLR